MSDDVVKDYVMLITIHNGRIIALLFHSEFLENLFSLLIIVRKLRKRKDDVSVSLEKAQVTLNYFVVTKISNIRETFSQN